MKLKRFAVGILSVMMLASSIALPASAATASDTLYAEIYGGATVSSKIARKDSSGHFKYTAAPKTSDGWSKQGDEWVYIRGRSSGGSQATNLHHRNYAGYKVTGSTPYLSGYGGIGSYYTLAIEYDNDNPYEYVNLAVTWTP